MPGTPAHASWIGYIVGDSKLYLIRMKTCEWCQNLLKVTEASCDRSLVDALVHSDLALVRDICEESSRRDLQRAQLWPDQWPTKDVRNPRIMTPIQYAAKNGQVEILEELLATGLPPEGYTCCVPMSPLYLACTYGQESVAVLMVESLLQHGADPDSCRAPYYGDDMGISAQIPIIGAARIGHSKVVELLCGTENPAVNVHAVAWVKVEIVRMPFCSKYVVDYGDVAKSALVYCVENGHVDVIRVLCRHGSFVNMVTGLQGPSLLGIAAQNNDIESIKVLCEMGADPNRWYVSDCKFPILEASDRLHCGALQELLRQNANVTVTGKRGRTSLHIVIENICRDIDFLSTSRTSPLSQNELNFLNILLQYRSLHGIKDDRGFDAIGLVLELIGHRCTGRGDDIEVHLELIQLFIEAGHPVPEKLGNKKLRGIVTCLDLMLRYVHVNGDSDFSNMDKFHPSAEKCCRVLELFISAGCKLDTLQSYCVKNGFKAALGILEATGILAYAQRCSGNRTCSLSRHTKLCIRDNMHLPIASNISSTALPPRLRDYVMLKYRD